ncbi:peptide chain release factor 1 [Spiroplasma endosymbiont of Crioceris asparagi]|uniref:peptide chain release factor 1 n=1 Tax=Spiroplasma endosymbiont of Crioceris asparagi TaxID=3066286 RepID=UPI0030D0AC9D
MDKKTIEVLEAILKKVELIDNNLADPNVTKNMENFKKLNKEKSAIVDVAEKYKEYKAAEKNYEEAKTILKTEKDKDLKELAALEIEESEEKMNKLNEEIHLMLLPKDPNNDKNIIMEIRGAAGGDEANIFAGDLFRMYSKYAEKNNWKINILDRSDSPAGGFAQISLMIKGKDVYSKLKFESGSHRVQRVPKTESKGRVQTSTATVAVLPEMNDVEIEIKPSDLRIDTYRSSGAGGQHVNTTDSAVRITHIPTGIVAASQDGRSQHDNKATAMMMIRSKVYEAEQAKQQSEADSLRKNAVGTGDRSEKIRTYNYGQNRVTDHRINMTLQKLDQFMEGNIDEIIEGLIKDEQKQLIEKNNI